MRKFNYPTIVIGAGAAGLVVAIGMAKAGRKVLLIEAGLYGGDCTNFGCIPSKTLIAASKAGGRVSGAEALQRVRATVAAVRSHEEAAELHALGIDTLEGRACFVDPHVLHVHLNDGADQHISGKHIVIATGSRPFIPSIDGLNDVPYRTNETIFDLDQIPARLAILGGGPIGCELALAFQRLGSSVSILQNQARLLPRDEPEASLVLHNVFKQAGIALHLQSEPFRISATGREIHVDFRTAGADRPSQRVLCDELLVATGRRPNTSGLGLEGLGIQMDHGAICVDAYGRTSHSNIWAIGDCTGGMQFTHMAESEGRSVLTSLLLPGPFKKKLHRTKDVPRCTFTDPEVGSLGWTEAEAVAQLGAHRIATYQLSFDKLDRAITDGRTEGFIKVVTKKWSSKILGATVVGPAAGELIGELSTAMHCGIPLRKLASVIHAYPTYSLAIRKVADMWLTQTILPSLKKLIGF